MKTYNMIKSVMLFAALVLCVNVSFAENIDPYEDGSQYAYGENVGWFNFEPNIAKLNIGATVTDNKVTGFIWAENIGWINLSPSTYGGVSNDGTGLLSGYAWAENVGWINFNPQVLGDSNHYGVTVNTEGDFAGWAWGENIGWIHLSSTTPVAYGVKTSWTTSLYIDFDDLDRFCSQWLDEGLGLTGDLDSDDDADFPDFTILAEKWLEKCLPGWPLAY